MSRGEILRLCVIFDCAAIPNTFFVDADLSPKKTVVELKHDIKDFLSRNSHYTTILGPIVADKLTLWSATVPHDQFYNGITHFGERSIRLDTVENKRRLEATEKRGEEFAAELYVPFNGFMFVVVTYDD
ncbi:hypothetical protein BGZ95_009911 [Linnemannia exigua]|uniref:Uncharacterized protein n=1 Tax=Linnemannia exigua TaxID=604196 RepID=A0AAD4DCB0_9FUNG|nr:hypothetical protein BGZ95_009911 [Linnemannia exigua]